MANDPVKELEAQMSLAMAALGVVFAQTLAEDDVPPAVLSTLRRKATNLHDHLNEVGAHQAASMFATFLRALHDKKWTVA